MLTVWDGLAWHWRPRHGPRYTTMLDVPIHGVFHDLQQCDFFTAEIRSRQPLTSSDQSCKWILVLGSKYLSTDTLSTGKYLQPVLLITYVKDGRGVEAAV